MSRPVASILVVAAAIAVIFAILAFWHANDGLDAERANARAAAAQVADLCAFTFREPAVVRRGCRVDDLQQVGKGQWRVRFELPPGAQLVRRFSCAVIDLKNFQGVDAGPRLRTVRTVHGIPMFWTYDSVYDGVHRFPGLQAAACPTIR